MRLDDSGEDEPAVVGRQMLAHGVKPMVMARPHRQALGSHRLSQGVAACSLTPYFVATETPQGLSVRRYLERALSRRNLTHVLVRRDPQSPGWDVPVDALSGFHWTGWSGGHNRFFRGEATRMLAAYMDCTSIPVGVRREWGHDCKVDPPPPHRIKVLIEKKKRYSQTYSDRKPRQRFPCFCRSSRRSICD